MVQASTVVDSVKPDAAQRWHDRALSELHSIPRVRAVVLTDRSGNVLQAAPAGEDHRLVAPVVDLLMGAANQTSQELSFGAVSVLASLCEHGMLIVASFGEVTVAVLAENEANLGILLNHVRRVFPEGDER